MIQDTLSVCLPYKESRERACRRPSELERQSFCERIESLLLPFFEVLGKSLQVTLVNPADTLNHDPFGLLALSTRDRQALASGDDVDSGVLQLASETGATQIIRETENGLRVGILNQYRYWTPSRARLLAADILQNHAAVFEEA